MGGGPARRGLLNRINRKKRFAALPTLLTIGNVVCGFGALAYSARVLGTGYDPGTGLLIAACLIYLAMVFDAVDGSAARWTNQTSEFGAQLDSLCDAVSFGAAPALLMLQFSLPHGYPVRMLWLIGALYVVCTVLRLARFNVQTGKDDDHRFFRGLPSPAAAGTIASFPLMVYGPRQWDNAPPWEGLVPGPSLDAAAIGLLPLVSIVIAGLMVSRFRYAHIFQHVVGGRRTGRYIIQLVFMVAVVFALPQVSVPLLFGWYAFAAPVQSLRARLARKVGPPQPGEQSPQKGSGISGGV